MQRILKAAVGLVTALMFTGCALGGPIVPDWSPEAITIRVYNNYMGTALVQLRLYHYGTSTPLAHLNGRYEEIILPVQEYSNYQLQLFTRSGYDGWLSEDLFFLEKGSCYEVHVNPKLWQSGLFACHSRAHRE